jgi:D-alanine-D-alanine ligase-like ATP-grasp enzyme
VYVVFGGSSSQRRQSCRSGRHVYLTLKRIPTIDVVAVVLLNNNTTQQQQLADATAWRLSYASALDPDQWDAPRAPDAGRFAPSKRVRADLEKYGWVKPSELRGSCMIQDTIAQRSTRFGALLAVASREGAIIFNAAHGGAGEDGALQQLCVSSGVAYTGSSPLASRVCMDKAATAKALAQRPVHGATCLPKRVVPASALVSKASDERGWGGRERVEGAKRLWLDIVSSFTTFGGGGGGGAADTNMTTTLVVKPIADGASRGVRRLMDERELLAYAEDVAKNQAPPPPFNNNNPYAYVFEPFFDASRAPWMECSFTLMGALGDLRVVGPSTIDARAKERARAVGHALGVEGCAALDAFVNTDTGELIVIEMNTVPDMTSPDSTVFAHARTADPPIDAETLCTRALSLALVRRFR